MTLKQTIINESLKLFSLNGFMGTSLHDILSAARTSKGGFYNHFASKEALFHEVLQEARAIWRKRNLHHLDKTEQHIGKLILLLRNYRDRYLLDADNFPGGCVFTMLAVELGDQQPHLCRELQNGFSGLRHMINRLIDQGKQAGELDNGINAEMAAEIIFSGMMGASINFSADKSIENLNRSINALIGYLETLRA